MSKNQENKIRNFLKAEEAKLKKEDGKLLIPMHGRVVFIPSSGEVVFHGKMMKLDARIDDTFSLDCLCFGAKTYWGTVFAVYCLESKEIHIEQFDGKTNIFERLNRELKEAVDIVSSAGDTGVGHIEMVNSGKEINPAGESRRFRIPKEEYRGPIVVS